MNEKNYEAIIEAILFTMGESVELDKIAAAIELDKKETKAIIEKMMKHYENPSIGVKIIELDDAYQMCTKSEMYEYLIKIARQPKRHVLTDVLLETLSIIAYKQPITKVEIEKIRGVSCDHAVNKLVEYNLVCELGRLDAPGRPLLFGTTEEFLRSFGVQSIDELPVLNPVQVEEFTQEAEAENTGGQGAEAGGQRERDVQDDGEQRVVGVGFLDEDGSHLGERVDHFGHDGHAPGHEQGAEHAKHQGSALAFAAVSDAGRGLQGGLLKNRRIHGPMVS